ncbi:unnamed protein product, partial [Rotaria sp. Silwood1]
MELSVASTTLATIAKFLAVYPKRVDDLDRGGSTAGSPSVSGSETSGLT